MNALRRVLQAPRLVFGLWLLQIGLAAAVGLLVGSSVRGALGGHTWMQQDHLLGGLVELAVEHRGTAVLMALAPTLPTAVTLLVTLLLSGGIITRLAGQRGMAAFGTSTARYLWPTLVQGVWHLLFRALLLGAIVLALSPFSLGLWRVLIVSLPLAMASVALDVARVQVVLHDARPFHIKTAALAFVRVFVHPQVLLRGMAAQYGQWMCVLGSMGVALSDLDPAGVVWLSRGLALAGVVLGLLRLATVVQAGSLPLRR